MHINDSLTSVLRALVSILLNVLYNYLLTKYYISIKYYFITCKINI